MDWDFEKNDDCPITNPKDDPTVSEGVESFDITDIPTNFGCPIFQFNRGSATVMMPTEDVMVQLNNPASVPSVVTLSDPRAVDASITLTGRARIREGGDRHSVRIAASIGLERRGEACTAADDVTGRDPVPGETLTAEASCGVSKMNLVQGSTKTNAEQSEVTEFEAEILSDFYIVMDHGTSTSRRRIVRGGGLYTVTIRTLYKFQAVNDKVLITEFLPPNKDENDNPIDLLTGDVTNFEATVRFSLESEEMANIVLNIFNHKGEVLATGDPVLVNREDSCLGDDDTAGCPVKLTIKNVTIPDEGPLFLGAEMIELTGVTIVQSPDIVYSVADLDFEVLHIEVTQAIQNNFNGVPLVADKKTFVRVYAKRSKVAGEDDLPADEKPVFPRLEVQLTGDRGGGQAKPLNPSTAEALPISEISIPVREASPIASAIFELPPQWTTAGKLVLTATVNPEGAVPELNSENNSSDPPLTVEFVRRNVFNILFSIDINYKPDFSIGFNAHRWMAKIFPTARVNYEPFNIFAYIFANEKYHAFLDITTDLMVGWSFEGGDPEDFGRISQRNDKIPFAYQITLELRSPVSKQGRLLAQAAARVLGLETQTLCEPGDISRRSSPRQLIRDVGFDPETKQIKLSRQNHNFLASCSNPWVSPGTYEELFETNLTSKLRTQGSSGTSMSSLLTLGSPPAKRQSQPAEYLILSGAAGPNGSGPRLDPVYRLESSVAPLPLPDAGEWCLELAGGGGLPSRHCVDEGLDGGEFVAKVPYRAGTQQISLTQMGQEVVARAASANAPSLQITSPTAGANLDASAPLTITWMASDADGDGLVFAVLQSADGGESWFPLTFDLTDAQFTFDGAQIQGGGDVFFRVLASDGFHTSEQVVGPVTLTQRPALLVDDRVRLGSAAAGQPAEGFVTVTGAGTGPVVIEAVTSDSPGFGVDPNTLPLTLLVGMSRKLFVEFTPSGVGVETAMLALTTNSPDQPIVNVLVEAEGLDPTGPILDTDLTEESVGFGRVGLGQASPTPIFLMNRGAAELNVEFAIEGEGFGIGNGTAALQPEQAQQDALTLAESEHATLTLSFEPSSLGESTGRLVLTSNDPAHARMEIALSGVGVELPPTPMILPAGIVDAAQFQALVAPGGIGSIFGSELADDIVSAGEVPLPFELGGARVRVDGWEAPLFFVSSTQINFQVPFEVASPGEVNVVVTRNGEDSPIEPATIAEFAPAVFINPNSGEPIIQRHPDEALITAANPAKPGDVLIIFVTGIGGVSNPPATGAATADSPLARARVTPVVTLGGEGAKVLFAGLTPRFAGLGQINIQLPESLVTTGATMPLVIDFEGSRNPPVNLSVLFEQ